MGSIRKKEVNAMACDESVTWIEPKVLKKMAAAAEAEAAQNAQTQE